MREKFLRGLTICAAIAFLASLAISVILEDHSCRVEIKREINSKIAENKEYLLSIENMAGLFKQSNVFNAEVHAITAAELVLNDPTILDPHSSRLEEIAKELRFYSITFISDDGTIDASWPDNNVGVNVRANEDFKELALRLDSTLPQVVPNVEVNTDQETGDATCLTVTSTRKDTKGVVVIELREFFKLSPEQLGVVAKPLDVKISRNGRLCYFPKLPQRQTVSWYKPVFIDGLPDPHSLPLNETTVRLFQRRLNFVYAKETSSGVFVGWVPYRNMFMSNAFELALICFCNFVVFLAIFTLVSLFVQKLFVDSIYKINRSLDKITAGNLDEKVDVRTSKEFVELSNGVNTTVDSLKEAAAEIKRITKEELSLAGKIQLAALPKLEEIYTKREGFDVYAEARLLAGLGGDMYDFFFVDESNVVFYIADVSGSGVAASLVMMKTMTLVKNFALLGNDLDTIVTLLNRYLADGKEAPYVSGFFCSLNLKTCELKYIDAGHIPPIIRRRDRNFEIAEPKRQLLLGLSPDLVYSSVSTKFEVGDSMLLYTVGFLSSQIMTFREFFDISKTLETLDAAPSEFGSRDYVETFFDRVLNVSGAAAPSDDVAALSFRFLSRKMEKDRRSQEVPNKPSHKDPERPIVSSLYSTN